MLSHAHFQLLGFVRGRSNGWSAAVSSVDSHKQMSGGLGVPRGIVTDLIGIVAFDDLLEVVNEELSDLTAAGGREQTRDSAARR
jgi:hypothetical protein